MKHPTPQQVAQMREDARMTQREFGELVNASPAAVQSWEAGRRACPLNTWELLLIYFGKQAPRIETPSVRPRGAIQKLEFDLQQALSVIDLVHTLTKKK